MVKKFVRFGWNTGSRAASPLQNGFKRHQPVQKKQETHPRLQKPVNTPTSFPQPPSSRKNLVAALHRKYLHQEIGRELKIISAQLDNPRFREIVEMRKHQPWKLRSILDAPSPQVGLNATLAEWGYDEEWDSQAIRDAKRFGLFDFDERANEHDFADLEYNQDTLTPTPGQNDDPCANASDKRACYLNTLQAYGVGMVNQADVDAHDELKGVNFQEFNDDQLAAIAKGVQATGQMIAQYFTGPLGDVSPEAAFQIAFGAVEFGYDPSRTGTGETRTTGDPTNPDDPIYIILDDKSFRTEDSIRPPLDPSFIVVHELGHAFHNRHGGKTEYGTAPIAGVGFAQATGSDWAVEQEQLVNYDLDGLLQPSPDQPGKYILPKGFYVALGYAPNESAYFPNERRGSNPSEGFADTFANFVLNPEILSPESPRREYFEANMSMWIGDIFGEGWSDFGADP